MKITLHMELDAESVAAAVTQVLYALDAEGGEVDVLEISGSPSYTGVDGGTTTMDSTTVVNNTYVQCEHDSDVHLDGEAILVRKARALPATLS
jgi:hypothetical protein